MLMNYWQNQTFVRKSSSFLSSRSKVQNTWIFLAQKWGCRFLPLYFGSEKFSKYFEALRVANIEWQMEDLTISVSQQNCYLRLDSLEVWPLQQWESYTEFMTSSSNSFFSAKVLIWGSLQLCGCQIKTSPLNLTGSVRLSGLLLTIWFIKSTLPLRRSPLQT